MTEITNKFDINNAEQGYQESRTIADQLVIRFGQGDPVLKWDTVLIALLSVETYRLIKERLVHNVANTTIDPTRMSALASDEARLTAMRAGSMSDYLNYLDEEISITRSILEAANLNGDVKEHFEQLLSGYSKLKNETKLNPK